MSNQPTNNNQPNPAVNNVQQLVQIVVDSALPTLMSEDDFVATVTEFFRCIQGGEDLSCRLKFDFADQFINRIKFTGTEERRCDSEQIAILKLILSAHYTGELRLSPDFVTLHQTSIDFASTYIRARIRLNYAENYMELNNVFASRVEARLKSLMGTLAPTLTIMVPREVPQEHLIPVAEPKRRMRVKVSLWLLSIIAAGIGLYYTIKNDKPECTDASEFDNKFDNDDQFKLYEDVCKVHGHYYIVAVVAGALIEFVNLLFVVYNFNDLRNKIPCLRRRDGRLSQFKSCEWIFSAIVVIASLLAQFITYFVLRTARSQLDVLPEGLRNEIFDQLEAPEVLEFISSMVSGVVSLVLTLVLDDDNCDDLLARIRRDRREEAH